jgi:hypothetical protein
MIFSLYQYNSIDFAAVNHYLLLDSVCPFGVFQIINSGSQPTAAESVPALVEHDLYASILANLQSCELLALVFLAQHTHVYGQYVQHVFQIFFSGVYPDFIHKSAASDLYLAFHDALDWFVLALAIQCGIALYANYQPIAMSLGFF